MSSPRMPVPSLLVFACLALATGCGDGRPYGARGDAAPVGAAGPATPQRTDFTQEIRGSRVKFDLVWVPEGNFWIGKTEVTWDEYLLYCDFEQTGKVPPGVDAVTKPSKPLDDVAPYDRDWGLGRRPAVGMSRNAATKYCEWLSKNTGRRFRLPTETEWALACGPRPEGDPAEFAWFKGNADGMTQEVGQKRPNSRGIHDMLGNLWEYCSNPFSPEQPKRAVLRGGCWDTDDAGLTPAGRLGFEPDWILADPNVPPGVWWVPDGNHLGFRVLCEPDK